MPPPRLALVEAIWQPSAPVDVWLQGMFTAFASALPHAKTSAALLVRASGDTLRVVRAVAHTDAERTRTREVIEAAPPHAIAALERALADGANAFWLADRVPIASTHVGPALHALGAEDIFTVRGRLGPTLHVDLTAALPEARPPRHLEVRAWREVGAHLAAACRLRARGASTDLANADVVLSSEGRVVGGTNVDDACRPELERRIRSFEAKRRAAEDGGELSALQLKRALIDGRWSVVERNDTDGKRFYVAVENPKGAGSIRRLTRRERTVVDALAGGESLKVIASRLGMDAASLRRIGSLALHRLGLRSRAELVLVFGALRALEGGSLRGGTCPASLSVGPASALLVHDVLAHPELEALTPAERALVPPLAAGIDDRTIAKARGVSTRTVANQTATLFKKLGVNARHELAAKLTNLDADAIAAT
jgi:DNA-binding NarL/FixJ family response regulator